jgi:hypothetical protein
VRLIAQGQKGGARTDHDHYDHSSLHHDDRSVYHAVAAEKEDINVVEGVEGIKVVKEECREEERSRALLCQPRT